MPGGKSGFVLGKRPKHYKILPQQTKMQEAAKACNIVKGISRAELVKAMTECIPNYFKSEKQKTAVPEGENHV
jgi:hypothetical protein